FLKTASLDLMITHLEDCMNAPDTQRGKHSANGHQREEKTVAHARRGHFIRRPAAGAPRPDRSANKEFSAHCSSSRRRRMTRSFALRARGLLSASWSVAARALRSS